MISRSTCPECDDTDLVTNASGEVVCENCALVVDDDRIDRGPEWRAYTSAQREQRSRVGQPRTSLMHDRGLTTRIGWRDKDANDRTLTPRQREKTSRLRTWQKRLRTRGSDEHNLQVALSEIQRMSSALDVPVTVRERAAILYRQSLEADMLRGRSIESVAAASLYGACRLAGIPRSLEEVSNVARVERLSIGRAYRAVSGVLDVSPEPVSPTQFVSRFASDLELDEPVRTEALSILEACIAEGIHAGKSPPGFAAAALYNAAIDCNEKRTQAEIADVADVTPVTIRKHYTAQRGVVGD